MIHFRHVHPVTPDLAEELLSSAVATRGEQRELEDALNDLPAPIYTTDSQGRVTFCNTACIPFSDRTPIAGKDRWCVDWKLCTSEGEPLPYDAIKQGRDIRGLTARAERTDGTRVTFRPYATPLFDELGDVIGAVNILIDITDRRQIERLRDQSGRCRRLACSVSDLPTLETLLLMAEEYDEKARNITQLN